MLLRAVHIKRVKKSQSSTHLADNLRRGIVNRSQRIQIDFYYVTGAGMPPLQTHIELNGTENRLGMDRIPAFIAKRDRLLTKIDNRCQN